MSVAVACRQRRRGVLVLTALCVYFWTGESLSAQTRKLNEFAVHPQLGINIGYFGEVETPARLGNAGVGLIAGYRQPLDKIGLSAIRVDAGYAYLGRSRTSVREREGTSSESLTEVELLHSALLFDIGLQLQVPRGLLRPYVAANGGLARFSSSVTVTRQFGYTTQQPDSAGMSDNSITYGGTVGTLLILSAKGAPIFLEAGGSMFRTKAFDALLISDVGTDNSGTLITPRRRLASAWRYVLFLGVSFTLR